MVSTVERYGWAAAFAVLITFAIPWFLWGDSRLLAGLPVWIWWHVGWMILASVAFWAFATRAWGLGVVPRSDGVDDGADADDLGGGPA